MNDLTKAKRLIQDCKNAKKTYLDLDYCGITNLEDLPELFGCIHLKSLYLSNNQISDISFLKELTGLQSLDLSNNQISDISFLKELTGLQSLDLSRNQISDISFLKELTGLQYLYLRFNRIDNISFFNGLKRLQSLDISNNKISDISFLKALTVLQSLYIYNNQISDITPLKSIVESSLFDTIWIDNNPYFTDNNISLEPFVNHKDTLLNEFSKLESKKIPIKYPLKICLLGNHHSGKTTFLDYFFSGEIKEANSTHILNIRPFYSKENNVEQIESKKEQLPDAIFYDFGGQDYYHGIYKAFLTASSTNLLFWHKTTDGNETGKDFSNEEIKTFHFNRQYWLGQLEFAEEKNKLSNIYQIQTYANDNPRQEIHINENTEKYFHIRLDTNALTKTNSKAALELLKEELIEKIASRQDEEKSVSEEKLYRFILNNRETQNKLKVSDLLGEYNKIEAEIHLLQAELDQLSKKGLILYYKNSVLLNDIVWINPQKTVKEIHDIFNKEKTLKEAHGRILKSDFEKNMDKDLIELLKHNKVIFLDETPKNQTPPKEPIYIVPSYLNSTTDEDDEYFIFRTFNKHNFSLKFEHFIPFGFINQLICKYGGNPEAKSYRKDQLVFTTKDKKAKVFIHIDYTKLLIKVGIDTEAEDSKKIELELFFDMLKTYWGIENNRAEEDKKLAKRPDGIIFNNTETDRALNNLKIPPDMYLSLNGADYVHYQTLENEKTENSIIAYKIKDDKLDKSNAISLPSRNFARFSNNENIKKMKKIFISYSRKDVGYKDELRNHLKIYKTFNIADNWSCEDIQPGKWNEQIQKELEESDFIIYMLSSNFFSSPYILEHEVLKGIKQNEAGKNNILCVIVSEFADMENLISKDGNNDELQEYILKLKDYQFAPYGQIKNTVTKNTEEKIIPLKDYENLVGDINGAYTKIINKINSIIKK